MPSMKTALKHGLEQFDRDTRWWGLSRRAAIAVVLVPIAIIGLVTLVTVAAHFVRDPFRDMFLWVTAEDGILEWPQFAFALAASLIFLRIGVQLVSRGQRMMALLYLLIGIGTFFVAGEEISWGQRVFGWGTPESLATINHQVETNVHNIRTVQRIFGFVVLFGGMYGALVPLLGLVWRRLGALPTAPLLIPPLCAVPAFLMPFGYRLVRVLLLPTPNVLVVKYGEAPELCLYIGMAVFAYLNMRWLSQPARLMTTHVTQA